MLDVANAMHHTGGEAHDLGPFWAEGVFVEPPTQTRSSQITGAGATVLRAAYTGGFIKMHGKLVQIAAAEAALVSQDNYLTSGQAVWFVLCAIQHRVNGAVSLAWVPGTRAAAASAAVPDLDDCVAHFGLPSDELIFRLGAIRFHRSADTVIVHQVRDIYRPFYVDEDDKTGITYDETDQSNMGLEYGGHIDVQMGLVQMSGIAAGSLYIDGMTLPRWPFGGQIYRWEYIPAVNGTGAGATQDLVLNIDGTPCTGTLTLTLANAVVPTPVSANVTAANKFKSGDNLDIEVDNAGTDFTAGSGTIRVFLRKYVRR